MTSPVPSAATRRDLLRRAAVGTAVTSAAVLPGASVLLSAGAAGAAGAAEPAPSIQVGASGPRRRRGKGREKGREGGRGTQGTGRPGGEGRGSDKLGKKGKNGRGTKGNKGGGKDRRLLPAADRHLVTRFSYGLSRDLADEVRRKGGARAWFEWQLRPGLVPDGEADALASWWPSLAHSPQVLWQNQITEVEGGWEVMAMYQRWLLLRRATSRRQVLEVMTEFWENHLHVSANGDGAFTYRRSYGEVIRAGALGRFSDLLFAAVTHPAMGIFLDNAVSTARRPNENLGRELLELHTVGRGAYSEDDVKASARILTGWRVDTWKTWVASYRPEDHALGPVRVMGFEDANASPDGQALTRRYLDYLAHHPATAQRICRKLVTKFVADDAPQSLVDELAGVYLRSGTDIAAVLRALVASRAFAGSAGRKVRDPGEDVVATYRALRVKVRRPTADDDAANAILWQTGDLGCTPFAWARPDGAPITNAPWSGTARMLASWRMHYSMAGGWWPSKGIVYRKPVQWLPAKRVRFDDLVDHLSREILHRPASKALVKACSQAVDVKPREVITRKHAVVRWEMARVLTTLLDSPDHLLH